MAYKYEFTGQLPITTLSGLVVANNFSRIVHGGRGAYVEFLSSHIDTSKLGIVKREHYYYTEYVTKDSTRAKVYLQRHRVDYADYILGLYYISPMFLREFKCTDTKYTVKDS